MKWPNKNEREDLEIEGFIKAYARFSDARQFKVVSKGVSPGPDYVVKDQATGDEFGVELTSVYIDDRSIPDVHMCHKEGLSGISYDKGELERYTKRIVSAVIDKVCKARKGYNTERPLILALYINEYISIYFDKEGLETLVRRYEGVFDSVAPFSEVVFWNLPNDSVFRVKPEQR